MIRFPAEPELPASQRASGSVLLRYEDVAQDGRILLDALPAGLGIAIWGKLLAKHPVADVARSHGVIPILTRFVAEGFPGPVSVHRPIEFDGAYQLAHTRAAGGEVDRIVLLMWMRARGVVGRTHGKTERDGEPIEVGRLFAEHVFTRPFAPAGERRVLRFPDVPGIAPVPEAVHAWRAPESLLDVPSDATPLDAELRDDAPVVFGVGHTDSNQHVNSLVYPRRFEEGVLRRLAEHGRSSAVLPRGLEIAYKRPFFAGDRARLALRTLALGGAKVGAVGVFTSADASKPHCFVRLELEP